MSQIKKKDKASLILSLFAFFFSFTALLISAVQSHKGKEKNLNLQRPSIFKGTGEPGLEVMMEDENKDNAEYYEKILNDLDDDVDISPSKNKKEKERYIFSDNLSEQEIEEDFKKMVNSNKQKKLKTDGDTEAKETADKNDNEKAPKNNVEPTEITVLEKPVEKKPQPSEGQVKNTDSKDTNSNTVQSKANDIGKKINLGLYKSRNEAIASWFRIKRHEWMDSYDYFLDKTTNTEDSAFLLYIELESQEEAEKIFNLLQEQDIPCKIF